MISPLALTIHPWACKIWFVLFVCVLIFSDRDDGGVVTSGEFKVFVSGLPRSIRIRVSVAASMGVVGKPPLPVTKNSPVACGLPGEQAATTS